jgi:F0F1-type ATP synthase assembly protein I
MSAGRKPDKWNAAWRQALATTSLGWDLALPIFGGALLGHFLDRWLETSYTFTLSLLALGVFTGFYNVMRSIQRIEVRERQRRDWPCVRDRQADADIADVDRASADRETNGAFSRGGR